MNEELKRKWVNALFSGEYKQGRGALRGGENNDEFCCLGVLCDIYDSSFWDGFLYDVNDCTLPDFILEATNLKVSNESDLINLNDAEKLSFEEIARWIEVNL